MSEKLPGGDTPFVPFADAPLAFGPNHKPFRIIGKDGQDRTRMVKLVLCAMNLCMMRRGKTPVEPKDVDEINRGFIAGANHDLRALGLGPLISTKEVAAAAEWQWVIDAVENAEYAPTSTETGTDD